MVYHSIKVFVDYLELLLAAHFEHLIDLINNEIFDLGQGQMSFILIFNGGIDIIPNAASIYLAWQ